jgi:hypothetical protein
MSLIVFILVLSVAVASWVLGRKLGHRRSEELRGLQVVFAEQGRLVEELKEILQAQELALKNLTVVSPLRLVDSFAAAEQQRKGATVRLEDILSSRWVEKEIRMEIESSRRVEKAVKLIRMEIENTPEDGDKWEESRKVQPMEFVEV